MLLNLILSQLKIMRIKRWLITYFISLIVVSLVALLFFRNSSYPPEHIALIMAIPVVIFLGFIKIISFISPTFQGGKSREKAPPQNEIKISLGFAIPSVTFLLLLLLNTGVAIIFAISSVIYVFLGLNWATQITWNVITIFSTYIAICSLAFLGVTIAIFVYKPHFRRAMQIAIERINLWIGLTNESIPKEFKFNDRRILPLHK